MVKKGGCWPPGESKILLSRLVVWFFLRRLFVASGLRRGSVLGLVTGHAFLKAANTLAHPAHQFWDFAAAKKNQHDDRDNQPVHWKFHKALLPATTLTRPLRSGNPQKACEIRA